MDSQLFEKIKNQLSVHEGRKSKLYRCSHGYLTGGIGHNFDANGLTEEAIDFIFNQDINEVEYQLIKRLPWYSAQPSNVKLVLLDMCFNLGINGLLKFKNTLKFIEHGRYTEASINMLDSLWAKQVGQRAVNLSKLLNNGKV